MNEYHMISYFAIVSRYYLVTTNIVTRCCRWIISDVEGQSQETLILDEVEGVVQGHTQKSVNDTQESS